MYLATSSGVDFESEKIVHLIFDEINDSDRLLIDRIKGTELNDIFVYNEKKKTFDKKILSNYDTIVVHGGDVLRIWNCLKSLKVISLLKKYCFDNNILYIGVSAGSLILTKTSTIIKDDTDYLTNIFNKKFLGVIDINFDVHFNILKQNDTYMKNLYHKLKYFEKPFYLLSDESFFSENLKICKGEIYTFYKDQIKLFKKV